MLRAGSAREVQSPMAEKCVSDDHGLPRQQRSPSERRDDAEAGVQGDRKEGSVLPREGYREERPRGSAVCARPRVLPGRNTEGLSFLGWRDTSEEQVRKQRGR